LRKAKAKKIKVTPMPGANNAKGPMQRSDAPMVVITAAIMELFLVIVELAFGMAGSPEFVI